MGFMLIDKANFQMIKNWGRGKLNDGINFINNHIVTHIPLWTIRKLCYRCCGLKIGKDSRILMGTIIFTPWRIKIGTCSIINEKCILDGRGGIDIGDNVSISLMTAILSATHDVHSDSFDFMKRPVIIGSNVWTGCGAIVLPGSVLECGAVVSAGSVAINKVYKRNIIYSGNPAKMIGERGISNHFQQTAWKPWMR
ncbi:MAG: acyltransferase [bacterium]|nr:acyltransferase [bacterium]